MFFHLHALDLHLHLPRRCVPSSHDWDTLCVYTWDVLEVDANAVCASRPTTSYVGESSVRVDLDASFDQNSP